MSCSFRRYSKLRDYCRSITSSMLKLRKEIDHKKRDIRITVAANNGDIIQRCLQKAEILDRLEEVTSKKRLTDDDVLPPSLLHGPTNL